MAEWRTVYGLRSIEVGPTPNAETLNTRHRRRWGAEEGAAQKAMAEIPKLPVGVRDSAILTFRGVPWRRRGNSAWGGAH